MAGSKAITATQFVEQFRRAWFGSEGRFAAGRTLDRNEFTQLPRRLGLAISGGADSMALAFLCRQLERSGLLGPVSVTGFVVDHRARAESSEEARTVAGWLDAMGIETRILELNWAQFASQDSSDSVLEASALPTAFETHARHLRFRALGLACQERGINALLMGHHQDDTVETTIWRLSSGGRGAGLAGIPEVARIPECHGLYGVSESGSSIRLNDQKRQDQVPMHVQVDDQNKGSILFNPPSPQKGIKSLSKNKPPTRLPSQASLPGVPVATGGIHLCRPLLSFPKARLLETCHANKIPYVSDPTNFDPTLTPRNAIRSMLASDSLPRALRAPSILSLISSSQSFLHTSTEFSNQLLTSRCRMLDLNLKSGTMVLQIVDLPSFLDPLQSQLSPSRLLQIQSLTLRRITELISPFHGNHFPVRSYEPFVDRLFNTQGTSHSNTNDSQSEMALSSRKTFTLGGLMFQPLAVKETEPSVPGGSNIWLLSRQPFFKNKGPVIRHDIALDSKTTPSPRKTSKSPEVSTPWTLWDDRYWLRFKVHSVTADGQESAPKPRDLTLVVRQFQKTDVARIRLDPALRAEMKRTRRKFPFIIQNALRSRLAGHAPGSARYTLPILAVEKPGADLKRGSEHLVALPTLDFRLDALSRKHGQDAVEFTYCGETWRVKWEWMFKMIDTEAVRLMGGPEILD
ncbi:hypothetical protein N7539_003837 [Penicillium diatomitis]|uniref:tRNA(Ile)-lysidine synthetase n=1 Tax=Penicillium diatomitis TaxID=2819901 RepID=A0A9W9XDW2_9EURO|nr:uncharacterized protein N7539_003837 [Penicillium diatomitis]KAJ5488947.1 hypothetical protein N7539_003837 [Penicillium diatomitis]